MTSGTTGRRRRGGRTDAIAGDTVLRTALIWWPLALALACVYFAFVYRMVILPARRQRRRCTRDEPVAALR
jgi:hypothetical protein